MAMDDSKWQFWIDRGGTFTDIVARKPGGEIIKTKVLSENPEVYQDAAIYGIRTMLNLSNNDSIPDNIIEAVKMGTTVATNALLERKGDRTVLVINKGLKDALRIAYQARPDIFAKHIILPELLYEKVIETNGRVNVDGVEVSPLELTELTTQLKEAYESGIRSIAVVLMHAYRYPDMEVRIGTLAKEVGFTQVSISSEVSPLMKIVGRGDTTTVDAYLSPILRRYVDRVANELGSKTKLQFMQSSGGLKDASLFMGKDAILSGPAGGIVGAAKTCELNGFTKIVGFDMGGTSTDVCHYKGEYERAFETEVAGVRMRAPMMKIHTVAAGGGSVLFFDGQRLKVGPESAGADPGPACYRRGGPPRTGFCCGLAVSDINVMLGKLRPNLFPSVFGPNMDQPLDVDIVRERFEKVASDVNKNFPDALPKNAFEVASGFLAIAVDHMAIAIKEVTTRRGVDVSGYALCSFGGAGGQHACLVADALGIETVFLHPLAGVLSAYGMGLAEVRQFQESVVELILPNVGVSEHDEKFHAIFNSLVGRAIHDIKEQCPLVATDDIAVSCRAQIRYEGTDATLLCDWPLDESKPASAPAASPASVAVSAVLADFAERHRTQFGFVMGDKKLIVESVSVEAAAPSGDLALIENKTPDTPANHVPKPVEIVKCYMEGEERDTAVYDRTQLFPNDLVNGPAIIFEATGTTIVEYGWSCTINDRGCLVIKRTIPKIRAVAMGTGGGKGGSEGADPIKLEIFNNLFMACAEQMGVTLQNVSYSVNIKERLDFSCAIFDPEGYLIANAPHVPVHLGSMSDAVRAVLEAQGVRNMYPGDVFALNDPYHGGTHIPDVTIITPVFTEKAHEHFAQLRASNALGDRPATKNTDDTLSSSTSSEEEFSPIFFVASRGHHSEIGGITPGSMPPFSRNVLEEGILIDNFLLVDRGVFRIKETIHLFSDHQYPSRNVDQNLSDLRAQIAANEAGIKELHKMVDEFGAQTVISYMGHVQDNAEEAVRRVIDSLPADGGSFTYEMDDDEDGKPWITIKVSIDHKTRSAVIDFTGTAPQQSTNFNAPTAISQAAVLYVFRTLVKDPIPLNAGCLKPLTLVLPAGSMVNPVFPAAVVAGNVEVSQTITDCLYGALGVLAGSQGTMNNFTFGNETGLNYYETICGGTGAGPNHPGCDAVHSHMTNTRLTDPEILEFRFPLLVESFSIRTGSGGEGQFKGGDGIERRIRFTGPDMTVSILANHRKVPPFGLAGGQGGKIGYNWVERHNKEDNSVTKEQMTHRGSSNLEPGDVFVIQTPGGGGYGNPAKRKAAEELEK